MKANDLRIGNYVYCYDYDSEGLEMFRNEIKKEIQVNLIDIELIFNNQFKSSLYQPIPLTEEWLLKLGFNKENDGAFTKNNICIFLNNKMAQNIFIKTSENKKEWFRIDLKTQYAHQLQNLYFALTGEELKIK